MRRLIHWAIQAAPVALMTGVAAFGLVAMLLLFVGRFETMLVWPFGLLAAITAMTLSARLPRIERPGSVREQWIVDGLALVLVVAWGMWNTGFTSQHVFTNRDPATYVNVAAWLANHNSLSIDTPVLSANVQGFTNNSPGFAATEDQTRVLSQGQSFLPVLMASIGRVIGEYKMLHAPVLISMAALLAVYGFARLLVKPRWALLAVAVLGVTLPVLYFSRDVYTEPLTMGLLFAGMTYVWIAHQTRRLEAWLLAGLVLGASAMTRIDVYISLAGILVFVAVCMSGIARGRRKRYVAQVLGFLTVLSGLAALSFVDMTHFSMPYLVFHKKLILQELLGLGVVLAASVGFVAVAWKTTLITKARQSFGRSLYVGAALLVIAGGLLLVSRPLWFVGQTHKQDADVAALQARRGLPIEPRSYTEQSVNWVAWYTGMPLATLGLIGLGVGVATAKRQQRVALLGVLVVTITGLVYFVQPSVAPDQIWATRRYLPIVLPGLVVFAMLPLAFVWDKYKGDLQAHRAFAALLICALLIAPLTVSRPFLTQRDVVQAPIIKGVCDALPQNAAVLWIGDGQYYLVQPTRSFCGVPAFSFTSRTLDWVAIRKVASHARAAGYVPVLAVMNGDKPILGGRAGMVEMVSDFTFQEMEMRLTGPPRFSETKTLGVSAAEITTNGSLVRLQPAQEPGDSIK